MSLAYEKRLIEHAKTLRKEMTPQERHLWYDFLRAYPLRFQRQKVIGSYIVDFYCHSAKVVVELDGSQHYEEEGKERDRQRDETLRAYGLTILRFSNLEIHQQFDAVCGKIHQVCTERTPPSGREVARRKP